MKNFKFVFVIVSFLVSFHFAANGQEEETTDPIVENLARQLMAYPQEKIYVHNDKTYYIAGEEVWFRAHLVNGMSHMPDTASRYVYAELIDPLDSIVNRVKIRPEAGVYQGHLSLPEELPEGEYHLRFYTKFMESMGDGYFFHKKITVGAPLSGLYRTQAKFDYAENGKKANVDLSFWLVSDGSPIVPQKVKIKSAAGITRDLKIDNDGHVYFTLNPQKDIKNNTLYLEYDYQDKFQRQFIPLPAPEDEYNVSFFPEGGNLAVGTLSCIAFKALKSNGLAENVSGKVLSASGDTVTTFKSNHLGMSSLYIVPQQGETYYAICTNEKGIEKRFELPQAQTDVLALKVILSKGMVNVAINHSPGTELTKPLRLIVHCRGMPIYNKLWDSNSQFLQFPQDALPSGVVNFLLVDENLNPISERLIFNENEIEKVNLSFETDKSNYLRRDLVSTKIKLTDINNNPLKGSMSISITDDMDVKPDTCNNIFAALLLASELKGYIESPAYYFAGERNRTKQNHLDALMLTQGWTRYNVPAVIKGEIEKPTSFLELGYEISGSVKSGLLMGKETAGNIVSLISLNYPFFDTTFTDENGKFSFNGFELPDTVKYMVQATSRKGGTRMELVLDENPIPKINEKMIWEYKGNGEYGNKSEFENYMSKAEERFVIENGVRTIFLKEVTVVGKAKDNVRRSPFSSAFNEKITAEQIEKMYTQDMMQILMRQPGVIVTGNTVRIRSNPGDPLILVDGVDADIEMLRNFVVADIEEIEIFKDATTAIFGSRGGNGVIMITTKSGDIPMVHREKFNLKTYEPLGYQVVKEFYTPVYDTPEKKRSSIPDLRTTVYWNPNVNASETGEAEMNFYAADASTTYSVVIEGMTPGGQIIHSVQKISRED